MKKYFNWLFSFVIGCCLLLLVNSNVEATSLKSSENVKMNSLVSTTYRGWKKNGINWNFYDSKGNKVISKWVWAPILDNNGNPTGKANWKFFNYLGNSIDQFYKNENGAVWLSQSGPTKEYYRGWWTDPNSGYRYYFREASGSRVTGRQYINGHWMYFRTSGTVAYGWQYYANAWRYNDPQNNGYETTGQWKFLPVEGQSAKNNWKYFNAKGENIFLFYKESGNVWLSQPGPKTGYYKGWWKDPKSGLTYHFRTTTGTMMTGRQYVDGAWRLFSDSGSVTTGWKFINNIWMYFGTNRGAQLLGRQNIGGIWYYLPTEAQVASNAIRGKVKGNKDSMIYHVLGQRYYETLKNNVLYFESESDAVKAGFRKSKI